MERAAIYARVSTEQQAEKGYSLGTQINACRQYAMDAGFTEITEFIDEGFSGEYIDRPALSQLREAIRQPCFVTVIVYDPDRLARNLGHQLLLTEEIEQSGASLRFVSVQFEQSPEGQLFYSIRGAVSAYEKEKIKERCMRGKRGKVLQGKIISDAKPYGYRYDRITAMYTIDDMEATVVRFMFDRLLAKLGTVRIAQELTEMGIATPRSSVAWNASSVYRIITNPIYSGTFYSMRYRYQKISLHKKIRYLRPEDEWVPITVPPIVDPSIWDTAQKQLQQNRSVSVRNSHWNHLLAGLTYCACCGRRMKAIISGSQSQPYYACPGRPTCGARRIPATLLDQVLWEDLLALFCQEDLLQDVSLYCNRNGGEKLAEMAIAKLLAQQAELLRRRQTVAECFSQQTIDVGEMTGLLQAIRTELQVITQRLAIARDKVATESLTSCQIDQALLAFWEDGKISAFTAAGQSAALHAVLDKVIVQRIDTTERKNSRPDLMVRLLFQ